MAAPRLPRIVILGGGFAGLAAAQVLSPARHRVTLVDRSRWFEFLPNIHELLSGVKTPELLRLPLDRLVRGAGHVFVRDEVTAIDLEARTAATARRKRPLAWDALVVALGGVNATHGVPGVEEHALPFKSVEQCARIGKRLAGLAGRKGSMRVVVVGGGLEGVEALGEILRRHRDRDGLSVTLVEARARLLPEAPAVLDGHVRQLCKPWDVRFVTGTPVAAVEADAVVLGSGERLASDCTIWTGGPAPPPLLAEAGLAESGQWASVSDSLQSRVHPAVFVPGDAASMQAVTKQAYHALDMGECASENAARVLAGDEPKRFRPSGKPALVSFGDLSTFLVAGNTVLAGPPLAAAKEGVYELVMGQLDRGPVWQALPRAARRLDRAARGLLWPALSSLDALRRQAHVSVLSLR